MVTCYISNLINNGVIVIITFFLDLNPAAQGASLTEGKRAKRSSKKVNGENGERSGSPDDENDLSAHDKSGEPVSF